MITKMKKSLKVLLMLVIMMMTIGTMTYATSETKITGLKVSRIEQNRLVLQWNGIRNIKGYEVYISIENSEYQYLGDARTNSISIVGIQLGKTYKVKVRAYTSSKNTKNYLTDFSDELTISTSAFMIEDQSTELEKVKNIKVDIDEEIAKATLSWDKVTNAHGYEVWVNAEKRGYTYLGSCVNNHVSITNFTRGIDYQIKLRAYRDERKSRIYAEEFSDEVTILVKAQDKELQLPNESGSESSSSDGSGSTSVPTVQGLNVEMHGDVAIFSWDKVSGADGYEMYISLSGASVRPKTTNNRLVISGFSKAYGTCTAKVRAYKFDSYHKEVYGLYSDVVKYSYQQESESGNGSGTGSESNANSGSGSNSGTNTTTRPANVTGLTVEMHKDVATFSWNKVSGADGYEIAMNVANIPVTRDVKTNREQVSGFTKTYGTCSAKVRAYKLDSSNKKIYSEDYSNEVKFSYKEETESGTGNSSNTTPSQTPNTNTTPTPSQTPNTNTTPTPSQTPNTNTTPTPSQTPSTTPTTPAKVTGLKVTSSGSTAKLSWSAVEGAKGYVIKWSEMLANGKLSTTKHTKTTTATSYSLSSLKTNNYGYAVQVAAYKLNSTNQKIYGTYSNIINFTILPTVTNVKVSLSGTTATVTWNKVAGATGYQVRFKEPSGATHTYYAPQNQYKINSIYASSGNYTVEVRAYALNSKKEESFYGAYSTSASFKGTVVKKVTGLTQIANNANGSHRISWNKVEGNNVRYEVYVEDAKGNMIERSDVGANSSTITKNAVKVKVRAYITQNGKITYGDWSNYLRIK